MMSDAHLIGALDAARRGYRVFPLRGKGQPSAGWQQIATTDPNTICRWWHGGSPGFGIKCGPDSDLWVVDDDREKHGEQPWQPAEGLPDTLCAVGQSGVGCRYLFRWPTDRLPIKNNNSGRIAERVDVRAASGTGASGGDGSGYIVCWGSFGGRLSRDVPAALAPPWLVARARGSASPPTDSAVRVPPAPSDAAARIAQIWQSLESTPWEGTSDNDQQTFRVACQLCSQAPWLGPQGVLALVGGWYALHAPIDAEWLRHKIDSAWSATTLERAAYELANEPLPSAPAPSQSAPAARGLLDIMTSMQSEGARIPLGYEPLDDRCRGGALPGWLVTIGGAPAAGKTMLLTQMGLSCARRGAQVRHLAIDEEPEAVLQRLLQQHGVPMADAERGRGDSVREQLAALDYLCIESRYLDDANWQWSDDPAQERIILIDSLQKVRTRIGENKDIRERVNSVITRLQELAHEHPRTIVICTSELSRSAYRSKADADDMNLMASGKETGDIEYNSHIYLVLQSVDDDPNTVKFSLVKARRGGQCGRWYSMLDRDRAAFSTDEISDADRETASKAVEINRDLAIESAIRQQIVSNPHQIAKGNIHTRVQHRAQGWARDQVRTIFELLCRDGYIAANGKGAATHYQVGRADWAAGRVSLFDTS